MKARFLSALALLAPLAACAADRSSDTTQDSDYTQYQPDAGSESVEAQGIALDSEGFPKERSSHGFSFGGCEYWPFAVSANPYPDHIVWGCSPGSTPQARTCMAASMRRLAVILKDPPPELVQVQEKYGISSFFNWNNDYTNAPEDRSSSERIWLYNGSLIKWMSATNRDGSCKLPERSDLIKFLNRCLAGSDTEPGC